MNIYNDDNFASVVDFKADDSPLTLADKASHAVIDAELLKLDLPIPVISEEGAMVEYDQRQHWEQFWLVDPLDGTKEFIKRNGQFTVNIALIKDKKPVMGVIYVPVQDTMYTGVVGHGAFKTLPGREPQAITVRQAPAQRKAVRSASHPAPEEDVILKNYHVGDVTSAGSSLKFCRVAEGDADLYYRHGPTMEWDTAAGQAIVEAAGGKVYAGHGPAPFAYNKEVLRNGSFLVLGGLDLA